MWDVIVLIPDHCLLFTLELSANLLIGNMVPIRMFSSLR